MIQDKRQPERVAPVYFLNNRNF